jgi:hypothetical protein
MVPELLCMAHVSKLSDKEYETMKMSIPDIGAEFVLSKDWTFKLYAEHRNFDLLKSTGVVVTTGTSFWNSRDCCIDDIYSPMLYLRHIVDLEEVKKTWDLEPVYNTDGTLAGYDRSVSTTLPKGTLLKIDRIYIRKGLTDYSSVSFYASNNTSLTKAGKPKRYRFWAKLPDVNNIEFK